MHKTRQQFVLGQAEFRGTGTSGSATARKRNKKTNKKGRKPNIGPSGSMRGERPGGRPAAKSSPLSRALRNFTAGGRRSR